MRKPTLLRCALSAAVLAGLVLPATPAGAAITTGRLGLHSPDAIALDAGHLYVANRASNTVTVVNPADGARVGTLGRAFHFDRPTAVLGVGGDILVANNGAHTVIEIAARTDRLIRVITNWRFRYSVAMTRDDSGNAYILGGHGRVTKLDVATGRVTRTAVGTAYRFSEPTGIAYARDAVFVTDRAGNRVTVLHAGTLRLDRVLSAAAYHFSAPTGLVGLDGNVWVTNATGRSITELGASTFRVFQVVPNMWDYLPVPGPIGVGDGYLFVTSPPGESPMVTQVSPSLPARLNWMMCNTNGPYQFSNPVALVVDGRHLWVVNEGGNGGPAGNSLTELNATTDAFLGRYS